MKIAFYDTNLTDDQWAFIEPMIPKPKKLGRPRTDPRRVLDAILYIVKGGIQWRLLPHDFPCWKTVYHIFRKWTLDHTWEAFNARLRAHVRSKAGKSAQPTAAILDSQSVKSDPHGGKVGYDAAKRIKGRKRHLLVDTLGLILGIQVQPQTFRNVKVLRICSTTHWSGTPGCVYSGWTEVIPDWTSRNGLKAFALIWRFRSSNARMI